MKATVEPRYASIHEWKKMSHTHTHTKMDLEGNILNEIHLEDKAKHCMISLKCGI